MVFEVGNCSLGVVALLDGSLVSPVDIVVEGVFEGDSVVLLGALDSNNKGSDDGFVGSPGVRDKSGGVEESGPDDVGLEVLLDSSLLHVPADDFEVAVSVVSDLDHVEAVAVPVVALVDVAVVEVVVDVVVVAKVVGGVDPASRHQ